MKILIIKFAAIGDVLRTTTILKALKKKYPKAKIWWFTEDISFEVLYNNPLIDKAILYNQSNLSRLKKMHFNLLINLDKDKGATYAAMQVPADIKKGFGQAKNGRLIPFDKDSNYAYGLGIDDELKFRKNKKTYQQICFEQIGLKYEGEKYVFNLNKKDIDSASKKLKAKRLKKEAIKVGIVAGSGKAFAGKSLAFSSYVKIIQGLLCYNGIQIVLLGGPREKKTNRKISKLFKDLIIDSGCNNTIGQFAAIVNNCDIVITGDTLTMHLGIALNKYAIVFFGSTAANEIELYGKGKKIIPKIKCSPCYKRRCPIGERCMGLIGPKDIIREVLDAVKRVFNKNMVKKVVFLDRDGVINKNPPHGDYIKKPSKFEFLSRAPEAIRMLNNAGFDIAVISNQAGIGKGLFSKNELKKIDERMLKGIKASGGKIKGTYYCIHHPDANCECRKPKTGLIKKAIGGNKIDFRNSFFIGDTERDVVAGGRSGLKTITVLSGYNKNKDIKKWKNRPDYIAKDLYDAVKRIVLQKVPPMLLFVALFGTIFTS